MRVPSRGSLGGARRVVMRSAPAGRKAVVVGCGVGDDAEAVSRVFPTSEFFRALSQTVSHFRPTALPSDNDRKFPRRGLEEWPGEITRIPEECRRCR